MFVRYHSLSELREKIAGVDACLLKISLPVLLFPRREADVELVAFAYEAEAVLRGRWLVEEA